MEETKTEKHLPVKDRAAFSDIRLHQCAQSPSSLKSSAAGLAPATTNQPVYQSKAKIARWPEGLLALCAPGACFGSKPWCQQLPRLVQRSISSITGILRCSGLTASQGQWRRMHAASLTSDLSATRRDKFDRPFFRT